MISDPAAKKLLFLRVGCGALAALSRMSLAAASLYFTVQPSALCSIEIHNASQLSLTCVLCCDCHFIRQRRILRVSPKTGLSISSVVVPSPSVTLLPVTFTTGILDLRWSSSIVVIFPFTIYANLQLYRFSHRILNPHLKTLCGKFRK